MSRRQHRAGRAACIPAPALLTVLLTMSACSPSSQSTGPVVSRTQQTADPSDAPDSRSAPPVLLNDAPVGRSVLWQPLAELAGGTVLQEYILDQALESRCAREGITVTSDDIQAELELIWESLDRDRQIAARLLDELRTRKGLGPTRFPALLRRNAMLRALIRDDVKITDETLRILYDQQYGTRYMLRIVTCAGRGDAEEILARARAGESLADLALLHSTDADTAAGSGLIGPVSVTDSVYPMAIRQILADLQPGEPSPILQLESSYAIVGLVHVLQPARPVAFEDVRDDLTRLARRRQERLLMESLARQLVAEHDINILDPSLGWSWREYRNAQGTLRD